MNCDCLHQEICPFSTSIQGEFSKILLMRFGGMDPTWKEIEEFVKRVCKHRISKNGEITKLNIPT